MARRPTTATQPEAAAADEPTRPAPPRAHPLSRQSAQAIADASTAAGFPVPAQAARVLAQPAEDQSSPETPAGDGEPKTEA